MDILFKNDDFVFSYRVGGILKYNGKILLQRPKNDDYAIIGGHVAAMETSMETLKREFEEELHAKIEVDNLLAIGEIYFPWGKRPCHQICLYYNVHLMDDNIPLDGVFHGYDELDNERIDLDFCWVSLEDLKNEQNFYLYSLLQDVMRKPVKFYKMIDEERKYLEIKLADNEIKDIMKSQIQHLGQIKVLVYYGVRKNVGGQYSYESTGYTKEQIAKYIFICLCFAPEYWVETNLEVKNNKMVTGWLDDEKTYKKCVTDFVKLSQEDFVAFAKKFSELKFVNCDISRVIDIIRKNADNQNYSSGDIQKFLLYIDVPKYIKEYQRFGFDGTMMISLLKMLHHYEGNWIMTWSTFLQKGLNDENPTLYDMLYTQQEMQSDIYIAHGNYERFEEKVPVKVIYNMFDMIDKDKNLFVFIYRDKNKNKQQNIVFVTDIDFDEIDCESFFRKYKMKFNGKEKLLKLKWREFKKNYVKFS